MKAIHSVEISWEDLIGAFTSGQLDKAYYLDRFTGEIFFVPSSVAYSDVMNELQRHSDRFLEIPPFDYQSERRLLTEFIEQITDLNLRKILLSTIKGTPPFGKTLEILSFYPELEGRFTIMKDQCLSSRLKHWMEENNLFTATPEAQSKIDLIQ